MLRTQLNNDYFHDLYDRAADFGIEIEGHRQCYLLLLKLSTLNWLLDTETGPGVLESALAYTNATRMADNAILFKYLAKSIGMTHGVVPSFMAKPWGNVSITVESFPYSGSRDFIATGMQWVRCPFTSQHLVL